MQDASEARAVCSEGRGVVGERWERMPSPTARPVTDWGTRNIFHPLMAGLA